jgi:hypothetical protein
MKKPGAPKEDPAYVYSTQFVAAWLVNTLYYGDVHFCYCSPDFGNRPSSSSPKALLLSALAELSEFDRGGQPLIREKLAKIRSIAEEKLKDQKAKLDECLVMLQCFGPTGDPCFPLLYIIDWQKVKSRAIVVPWAEKANLWSSEVKITDLHPDEFTVISFE